MEIKLTHVLKNNTCVKLEMPSTKQMASKIFDFPLPFNPVIALKRGSNPLTTVRVAYDLKPSIIISYSKSTMHK